jgi:hypothetical protein
MIKEWLQRRRERKLDKLILESIDKCRKQCHLMPNYKLPEDDNNMWEALVQIHEDDGSFMGKRTTKLRLAIKGKRSAYCVARAKALELDQYYPKNVEIGITWEISKL